MITLQETPPKQTGFYFELIKEKKIDETNKVLLWRKCAKGKNNIFSYEVHKSAVKEIRLFREKAKVQKATHYWSKPSTNSFGRDGWSYSRLEDAEKKFEELTI